MESGVNRSQNKGCEQEANTVRYVAHHDKQRGGQHLDAISETAFEQLVDGHQLATKVRRNEEQRDNDAPEQVAEDELEKLEIPVARKRDPGNGDESDRRGFRGDNGGRDGPPGHGAIAKEVVARGFLFTRKPNAKQRDADQVAKDDDEIDGLHLLPQALHQNF